VDRHTATGRMYFCGEHYERLEDVIAAYLHSPEAQTP
jgi:hypothetical protein